MRQSKQLQFVPNKNQKLLFEDKFNVEELNERQIPVKIDL